MANDSTYNPSGLAYGSPELALNRGRYQSRFAQENQERLKKMAAEKSNIVPSPGNKTKSMAGTGAGNGSLGRFSSLANQARQLKLPTSVKNIAGNIKVGAKMGSAWSLTSAWGSVWLDWTLLSLLYLNAHFFAASIAPQYIAQFGEDHLFGKIFGQDLAKLMEIIFLGILDIVILSLILIIGYAGYKAYSLGNWDWAGIGLRALLPGQTMEGAIINKITN